MRPHRAENHPQSQKGKKHSSGRLYLPTLARSVKAYVVVQVHKSYHPTLLRIPNYRFRDPFNNAQVRYEKCAPPVEIIVEFDQGVVCPERCSRVGSGVCLGECVIAAENPRYWFSDVVNAQSLDIGLERGVDPPIFWQPASRPGTKPCGTKREAHIHYRCLYTTRCRISSFQETRAGFLASQA